MLNNDQIDVLKQIVIQAGKQVLNIKNKQINVFSKIDKSPVTLADIQSNRIICDTLKKKSEIFQLCQRKILIGKSIIAFS